MTATYTLFYYYSVVFDSDFYKFAASGKMVDASQEMMTLGLCNIFGSFVQAMPTCGAFTRSAVSHSSGVRTPLAGLYSGKHPSTELSSIEMFENSIFSYVNIVRINKNLLKYVKYYEIIDHSMLYGTTNADVLICQALLLRQLELFRAPKSSAKNLSIVL